MSKNDIILLAWFSPILICVVALPFALVLLFFQKLVPFLATVLWRHYPRWWKDLPKI